VQCALVERDDIREVSRGVNFPERLKSQVTASAGNRVYLALKRVAAAIRDLNKPSVRHRCFQALSFPSRCR
jgi:hypothetical protein